MKPIRILVVDDEQINLDIIAECLSERDYELAFATDGSQAWDLLNHRDENFDIVVLDRMMPVMNGLEVLHRIKAESQFQRMPVIMQTAAVLPEQVKEGLAAGAFYYLTKPYEPEALIAIVDAAVEKVQAARVQNENSQALLTAMKMLNAGEYRYSTLEEARALVALFSSLCPMPDMAAMGLTEILINAVEHGNLGISYDEKKHLKQTETWDDEVKRRLQMPAYRDRKVVARVHRMPAAWQFTITDEGEGFNWQKYMDFDPERAFDPNGRGIAMARQLSFSCIEYRGRGNEVAVEVKLEAGF